MPGNRTETTLQNFMLAHLRYFLSICLSTHKALEAIRIDLATLTPKLQFFYHTKKNSKITIKVSEQLHPDSPKRLSKYEIHPVYAK